MKKHLATLKHYGWAVVLAVVLAMFIRSKITEAYRIPSGAMSPALESGDVIFVAKWPFGVKVWGMNLYSGRVPRHGEVVVFSPFPEQSIEYIKRVVAVGGEKIEIKKGQVFINSRSMVVPGGDSKAACGRERLFNGVTYAVCWEQPLMDDLPETVVPAGSVFVLGDLRTRQPGSKRHGWGIVPFSHVTGSAVMTWLSIEPSGSGRGNLFSRIRFERMLRGID
ncbi:MAG: signal peptidase I [Bdellovibrionales bacterium RIFOXYD1_FULL_53_11]|nr:MAG: signal peptidase I [Bdellovibrionales bacterium RIFOXYD1_FULL_53_11]